MILVASFYHLPPRLLPSINAVEGGDIAAVRHNTNGTDDLGVMQINTIWLEPIARITGMTVEAVRTRLVTDACFNIAAAGAILRTYLNERDGDLMLAVGDYHSRTPLLNREYQLKVTGAAERLFGIRRQP